MPGESKVLMLRTQIVGNIGSKTRFDYTNKEGKALVGLRLSIATHERASEAPTWVNVIVWDAGKRDEHLTVGRTIAVYATVKNRTRSLEAFKNAEGASPKVTYTEFHALDVEFLGKNQQASKSSAEPAGDFEIPGDDTPSASSDDKMVADMVGSF